MKKRTDKPRGKRSPTDIDRAVGANLRKIRVERDLSLQVLAAEIGVSHQQLQKYETGANRLSAGMLPVVADALGIEVIELFQDATGAKPARKSKADKLREECDRWLSRTKSEDTLRTMSVILKALSTQGKADEL